MISVPDYRRHLEWNLASLDGNLSKRIKEMIQRHRIEVENFTEKQVAEAIHQMIKSGDFYRLVNVELNSQAVIYEPFREREQLMGRIAELEQELEDARRKD